MSYVFKQGEARKLTEKNRGRKRPTYQIIMSLFDISVNNISIKNISTGQLNIKDRGSKENYARGLSEARSNPRPHNHVQVSMQVTGFAACGKKEAPLN